jgi:excisionase family DNA binding protein
MKQVQFIQTTPEELQNAILKEIDKKIDELKAQFQPKEPTVYVSREEVAKMLGISVSTLGRWVKQGKLTTYGFGRKVYYKREDIEAALIDISPKKYQR